MWENLWGGVCINARERVRVRAFFEWESMCVFVCVREKESNFRTWLECWMLAWGAPRFAAVLGRWPPSLRNRKHEGGTGEKKETRARHAFFKFFLPPPLPLFSFLFDFVSISHFLSHTYVHFLSLSLPLFPPLSFSHSQIHTHTYLPLSLSIYLSLCLSLSLSIFLSFYLSIPLSLSLMNLYLSQQIVCVCVFHPAMQYECISIPNKSSSN